MDPWTLAFALAFVAASTVAAVLARMLVATTSAAKRIAASADSLAGGRLADTEPDEAPDGGDAHRRAEEALGRVRARCLALCAFADALAERRAPPAVESQGAHDQIGASFGAAAEAMRALRRDLAETAISLGDSARSWATHIKEIHDAGQAQTAATEETAATIEEMASQIQNVAQNAEVIASHADETSREIGNMVSSNEDVARSGENVMQAVGDAGATMETMATSVVSVADTAERLGNAAQQVAQEAASGDKLLDDSADKLRAVSERTQQSSAVIERLGERSQQIGSIVKMIESIADQTNLLALNAAIEAARAGDAGRGFAVVADEVRKLAERSMSATKEISEVIDAVQSDNDAAVQVARSNIEDIREGAAQVVDTNAGLKKIIASIEEVTSEIGDVRQATQEQSLAADEVMRLVKNMNDMTRRMVDSTRDQASSSHNVLNSAQEIARMIQQVADASAQQKVAGDQILVSIEHVTQVSAQHVQHVARLDEAARSLTSWTDELRALAGDSADVARPEHREANGEAPPAALRPASEPNPNTGAALWKADAGA